MPAIFKMKSETIMNVNDLYRHFDILDILRRKDTFYHFALGHLNWSHSINLYHIGVFEICLNKKDADLSDYWKIDQKRCKISCNDFDQFEYQSKTVDKIIKQYYGLFTGEKRHILMLTIAAVLLGNKTEMCLEKISASDMMDAYNWASESQSMKNSYDTANDVKDIVLNSKDNPSMKIKLSYFGGHFRLPFDPSLRPSAENRYETWTILGPDNVKATIELYDRNTEQKHLEIVEASEKVFCLVLDNAVVKILPKYVENGGNHMERKKEGIFFNDTRCDFPSDISSFVVGPSNYSPWVLYVSQGHLYDVNADGLFSKKVSDKINTIAEVYAKGNSVRVVRNDGMVWNGNEFVYEG